MSEISGGSDDKEDMSTDDKISAYESLLMDCKEAIEVITNIKDSSNLKKKIICNIHEVSNEFPIGNQFCCSTIGAIRKPHLFFNSNSLDPLYRRI